MAEYLRPLLYLLSLALSLPGILAALALQAFSGALAQPNLLEVFLYLLRRIELGITWHLWGALVALALLSGLAFFPAQRWAGAAVITLATLASIVYLALKLGVPPGFGETAIYWGGLLALGIAAWVLATDPLLPWRRAERNRASLEVGDRTPRP